MATTTSLHTITDAEILADLQSLGTAAAITGYSSVVPLLGGLAVPTVTWDTPPTPFDENMVTAYFQQNNPLRNWTTP